MDDGNWVILSILLRYKFRTCVLYKLAGVRVTKTMFSLQCCRNTSETPWYFMSIMCLERRCRYHIG